MKKIELNIGLFRLFLTLALFFTASINAQNLSVNIIKETAKKEYWSKLLHYENSKSIIETKDFFLSSDGNKNLESELESTIEAFKNDPTTKCRYPARYKWLNSLGIVEKINVECKKLDKFLQPNFSKMSIVYSTERYSAAASLFGHVLLKLDSDRSSNVIEYTAKVPVKTGPLSYVINGVFGGFTSKYNYFSFFVKDYEARGEEFRDLVVYELNFTKDEINNILLHLYEVKDTTQKYYFLSRNCSSELIKLLDMSDYSLKKRDDSKLFVLPIEVITAIEDSGKIKSVKVFYSTLKQFYHHYEALDEDEKEILKDIIYKKRSVHSLIKDSSVSRDSKDRLVLCTLLYYNVLVQTDDNSSKVLSKILTLSKYRNNNFLEYGYRYKDIEKNPISPYIYKASLGYLYKEESYATLNFRNLYKNRFDLLDALVKNGTVEFLDFTLRANEKVSLESFKLIHLASMPLSSEFFSEPTKELNIGLKRLFYDDELYANFEYGIGKRMRLSDTLSYAFSVYGGVYDADETLLALGIKTELEYKLVSKYLFRIGLEAAKFKDKDFEYSLNDKNAFAQMHFRISNSSLIGAKLQYYDNQDKYCTSSIYYNYSF